MHQDELATVGYFEQPGCVPLGLVARAREAVEQVTSRGAPAVVAFASDPFWDILEHAIPIGEAALGGEAVILPAVYAWRVAPGSAGWRPHRDDPTNAFMEDGRPAAVTLWIALTEATSTNGCVHVVPAPWDVQYGNPKASSEVLSLQHVCALPAAPGTLFGWTHAMLHWGGAALRGEPRISVSFELRRADADQVGPAHARGWRPAREERIALVRAMLRQYAPMHEYSPAVLDAAEALLREG